MAPPPTPVDPGFQHAAREASTITASTRSPPAASLGADLGSASRLRGDDASLGDDGGFAELLASEKRSDMLLSFALIAALIVGPPSPKTSRERHAPPHRLPDLRFRRHERHHRDGLTSPTPISRGEFGVIGRAASSRFWRMPHHGNLLHSRRHYRHLSGRLREDRRRGPRDRPSRLDPCAAGQMTRDQEEAGLIRGYEAIRGLTGRNRAAIARRPGT